MIMTVTEETMRESFRQVDSREQLQVAGGMHPVHQRPWWCDLLMRPGIVPECSDHKWDIDFFGTE